MTDEDRLWQDERAAALRARDREREPRRLFPPIREGARNTVRTERLECPCCGGPVYVASDSDGEAVTCANPECHTELETYQLDGKVQLEIVTLDIVPPGDVP